MTINREISQFGNFLIVDENVNNNVGIATTIRISGGGGLYVGGIEVISPDGVWKGSNSGLQGVTGAQGIQGTTGTQGTQGIQGRQGIQGITGGSGGTGTQGIQGITGGSGGTGTQGTQGTSGTQGTTGTGTQGIQGIQGITGTQGTTGTQGIQGITGTQGTSYPSGSTVPTGAVFWFAASTAPTGYLECSGAAVSRTTYSALFAITGTTFGSGDGSTTFNLPNLRGEFIRGWDNGRNVDTGRTFGSSQTDDYKSHTHSIDTYTSLNSTGAGRPYEVAAGNSGTKNTNASPTSGGTETRPRNIALLPCIKT